MATIFGTLEQGLLALQAVQEAHDDDQAAAQVALQAAEQHAQQVETQLAASNVSLEAAETDAHAALCRAAAAEQTLGAHSALFQQMGALMEQARELTPQLVQQ